MLMIKEHPITGLGLGSFSRNYLAYASRLYSPPLETMILHPHNLFFQLAVSLGLLGAIGFVLIVIQWWHQLVRIPAPHIKASLAAGMIAILLHGLIDTTYFKNDLAAIFWFLIGFTYVARKLSQKV
jgi:O-antigen ligase